MGFEKNFLNQLQQADNYKNDEDEVRSTSE